MPVIHNYCGKIPEELVPFDKRNVCRNKKETFIHFYMHDKTFKQVLRSASKYEDELRAFGGVISPDCSLYRDMPLALQIMNTYANRAVGYYYSSRGIKVIPNVRWGDERSYEFCFDGLYSGGIYSVGSHGCIKNRENRRYFKKGLEAFILRLKPKTVLVYGPMPEGLFKEYCEFVEFIQYDSYISKIHRNVKCGGV